MGKAVYVDSEVEKLLKSEKEGSYNRTLRKLLGMDVPREQLATKPELEELKERIRKLEEFIEQHTQ